MPLPLVHLGLTTLQNFFGEVAFATWQEAELMQVSMISEAGTAHAESLGISPLSMSEVLSAEDPT